MKTKTTINKIIATSLCMNLRMIRAASSNPEGLAMVLEALEVLARPLPERWRLNDFIAHEASRLALFLVNYPAPDEQRQKIINTVLGEPNRPLSVTASQGVTA